MGDGEKDARDEGEGVGKEKTASSSKEEDEKRSSINKLQHDMDEHVLNGMKYDDGAASRKRKLGKFNEGDESKKEEEPDADATTKANDPKKKNVEDTRNFKLVVKKSKVLEERLEFPLPCGSDIVIGRQTNACDVVISDLMISKRHCKIVADRRLGPCVYDLGSKGDKGEGDAVKRFPIPIPQEGLMLKLHDELTIGNGTVIVLELADNSAQAPSHKNTL